MRLQPSPDGTQAVLRGVLQFVLPVEQLERERRRYDGSGLRDMERRPASCAETEAVPLLDAGVADSSFSTRRHLIPDPTRPWIQTPISLHRSAQTPNP